MYRTTNLTPLVLSLLLALPAAAATPVIKTVPAVASNAEIPHEALPKKAVTLKATSSVQGPEIQATWDFGDSAAPVSFAVSNRYDISAAHAYAGGAGQIFTATLTILNTRTGESASAKYKVAIRDKSLDVQARIAVDEALWYLHKSMSRTRSGAADGGDWTGRCGYACDENGAVNASNVLAFEAAGFLASGDSNNPYSETVSRSLNSLFEQSFDTRTPDWTEAIAAAKDPDARAATGPADVAGHTYREIVDAATANSSATAGKRVAMASQRQDDVDSLLSTVRSNTQAANRPIAQLLVDRQNAGSYWTGHNAPSRAEFETSRSVQMLAAIVPNAVTSGTILNVSSQVRVTSTGFAYSRVTKVYTGTMTVANISGLPIAGPLNIVFTNLVATVTVANSNGTFNGDPYLTVPNVTTLNPGQSADVTVNFNNPGNIRINYTVVTYSGVFPPAAVALSCPTATGTNGTAYSSAITASGGVQPYLYSINPGTLPSGLQLDVNTGAITGTPTGNGPFTFTANVSDETGAASGSASTSCTITISPATSPLSLACPAATAQVGTAYSSAFVPTGGTPGYTYSIITGSLPSQLNLNTSTGAVTGTPDTAGLVSFTGQATDSTSGTPLTSSANCSINVSGASTVAITVQSSPAGQSFTVDGTTYSTTQTFNWVPGSSHTLATTSPQGSGGTRFVFNNWSDGGAISHSVTGPAFATTYTVSFDTQYQLTTAASPSNGGTVTPASGSFFAAGSTQTVSATPNANFTFANWTGPVANANSASTTVTMTGPISVTANFTGTSGVTVQTSPAGQSFTVDGTTYTTAQNFTWTVGSTHTIATTSPQGSGGTRFVFNNWSDGGAISHQVTAPAAATTYTASFDTQYQLTTAVSPANGGTVTPASGSFFAAGSTQNVAATPNANFSFTNWTGPVANANSASTTVTMTGPISVTANFAATISVTVQTSLSGESFTVDGTTYTTSQSFTWTVGSSHTLATTSPQGSGGTRFIFNSWSDGGAISHSVTGPAATTTYTAVFDTQFQLTTAVSPSNGGTVTPASGSFFAAGSTQAVQATPNSGFAFNGWTGPVANALAASTTVTLNAPVSITANFATAVTLACPTTTTAPIGSAYSSSVVASGGSPSYVYSLQSGTLPPPLTLSASGVISGTPTTKGTYNFVAKVLDGTSPVQQSATASCSILVPNRAPSATGQSVTTNEDTAKVITLAGSDPDGDALTFTIVANPAHGTLSSPGAVSCSGTPSNCTRTITYTPAANYNGADSFTFKVNDGTVDSASNATVTITITAVNDPPVAVAKNYTAQANMKISIPSTSGLLIGATDPDSGDAGFTSVLTIGTISGTSPAGGTVTVNTTTGAFDFDPPPGVTGNVTFTYTVCDNGNPLPSLCSAATNVTVNVGGPVIWFANPALGSNGTGTLNNPFNSLSAATTALGSNTSQRIFVYSGTTASGTNVTLGASDWLVGQGVTGSSFDSVMGIAPPSGTIARPSIGGTAPTIQGTVTMNGSNTEVLGVKIQPPSASAGLVATVGPFTGLVVSDIPAIVTTNARAVNLNNASGTFSITSVSATSADIGINLASVNPGVGGSFTVLGSGGACSAATTTCSGGTISGSSNIGISLSSSNNVSISRMRVRNSTHFGLQGSLVSNLSVDTSLFDGTSGATSTEGTFYVTNWLGSGTLSNSEILGGAGDNVHIQNTQGVLNRLTVSNTIIRDTAANGNDGMYFATLLAPGAGSGVVMNLTVTGSTFQRQHGDHFQSDAQGLSTMDIVFSSNTLSGGNSGALGNTVVVSDSNSSHVTVDFNGNTINGAILSAYTFFQPNTSTASASLIGKFRNNIIGTTGVAGSGSSQGDGLTINPTGLGTMTMNVTGNTIRQYGEFGIQMLAGDTSPHLNVTITGNTVKEPFSVNALQGIKLEAGTTSAGSATVCVDIGGAGALANDANGSGGTGLSDYRLRQLNSSTVQLPGLTGAVNAFIAGRNNDSTANVTSVGSFGNNGGAACPQAP